MDFPLLSWTTACTLFRKTIWQYPSTGGNMQTLKLCRPIKDACPPVLPPRDHTLYNGTCCAVKMPCLLVPAALGDSLANRMAQQ